MSISNETSIEEPEMEGSSSDTATGSQQANSNSQANRDGADDRSR